VLPFSFSTFSWPPSWGLIWKRRVCRFSTDVRVLGFNPPDYTRRTCNQREQPVECDSYILSFYYALLTKEALTIIVKRYPPWSDSLLVDRSDNVTNHVCHGTVSNSNTVSLITVFEFAALLPSLLPLHLAFHSAARNFCNGSIFPHH
jgi:hypothetical protein